MPFVACFFYCLLIYLQSRRLNVSVLFRYFASLIATLGLKVSRFQQQGRGSPAAYYIFQEIHYSFNWRGMSQCCENLQQSQAEND